MSPEEIKIAEFGAQNGKTKEEVKAAILKYRASKAPAETPGYSERVKQDFATRAKEVQSARGRQILGGQTRAETFAQTLGQGIGMVTDIATEAPGVRQVLGGIGKGIEAGSKLPIIRNLGDLLSPIAGAGIESYQEASPRTQANIKAAANIASVVPIAKAGELSVKGAGFAIEGGAKVAQKVKAVEMPKVVSEKVDSLRGYLDTKQKETIVSDVDNLFKQNRAIENKVKLAEQKNVPLKNYLSEPVVFKGLKVENGSINPDEAIRVLENRASILMDAKKEILPELDKILPKVSREELRQTTLAKITGAMLPEDEKAVSRAINKQIDALPEEVSLVELDALRALARKASRDAKGMQRRDSEYTALENASRDTLFAKTDDLPFDTNKEFPALNNEVKNLIETMTFLDKTLRGQKVKGGRLGTYSGRIIGAVAGAQGGLLGSLAGSEIGGAIANIITNNQLGSSLKMKLIQGMTDDPEILREVAVLLKTVKDYKPAMLPAPAAGAPKKVYESGATINLPAVSGTRKEAEEIKRIQSQLRK